MQILVRLYDLIALDQNVKSCFDCFIYAARVVNTGCRFFLENKFVEFSFVMLRKIDNHWTI